MIYQPSSRAIVQWSDFSIKGPLPYSPAQDYSKLEIHIRKLTGVRL